MTIISVIICHYQTLACYIIGTGQSNLSSEVNKDVDNDANNNDVIDEKVGGNLLPATMKSKISTNKNNQME